MAEARPLRELALLEIAAVIAAAVAPLPERLPAVVPLLVAAMLSRALRRRGWTEVMHGDATHALVGAAAGLAALAIALVVGTPALEAALDRAIEWSRFAIVRGSGSQLVAVVVYVAMIAVAAELVLRGWLVERVLEFAPAQRVLAVLVGAIAEAALESGTATARLGAFAFGLGLGWIYVAGNRSVVAPVCARVAFQVAAVMLEATRVIG